MSESQNQKANEVIFLKLKEKFEKNLLVCLKEDSLLLNNVEIKARMFAGFGQILKNEAELSTHQDEIIYIFDELFSDTITSIYFAACSLDKPAQIVLRRVLELGITTVYLWDLPTTFWAWKIHDKDLNYNEMLDHLTNDTYKTYISSINMNYKKEDIIDIKLAKAIYRKLSNTMHGKPYTFETMLPDKFNHVPKDWEEHLKLVECVEDLLFHLWTMRFPEEMTSLKNKSPSIVRR